MNIFTERDERFYQPKGAEIMMSMVARAFRGGNVLEKADELRKGELAAIHQNDVIDYFSTNQLTCNQNMI